MITSEPTLSRSGAFVVMALAERADAQGDCDKIQAKLDEIAMKWQQAIAWALAKMISEDDLKMQLMGFER
jgi:hypothetical protein